MNGTTMMLQNMIEVDVRMRARSGLQLDVVPIDGRSDGCLIPLHSTNLGDIQLLSLDRAFVSASGRIRRLCSWENLRGRGSNLNSTSSSEGNQWELCRMPCCGATRLRRTTMLFAE